MRSTLWKNTTTMVAFLMPMLSPVCFFVCLLVQTVQGTIIYIGVYYIFLIPFQSFSKLYLLKQKRDEAKKNDSKDRVSYKAIKYYNSRDKLALTGDRAVGNFMEFAIIFLPLLWIHALFVDPTQSLTISLVYTAIRAAYPLLFGSVLVFAATIPGYMVLTYMLYQISREYLFDLVF